MRKLSRLLVAPDVVFSLFNSADGVEDLNTVSKGMGAVAVNGAICLFCFVPFLCSILSKL
jgi:hypothetical protein